jgi:hypothetical protein
MRRLRYDRLEAYPTCLLIAVLLLAFASQGCFGPMPVHEYDQAVLNSLPHLKLETVTDQRGRVYDLKAEKQTLTAEDLAKLFELTELQRLSLYGATFPEDALKSIHHAGRLDSLGLGNTQVTDVTLDVLADVEKLGWLWIGECEQLTDEAIVKFRKARPNVEVFE